MRRNDALLLLQVRAYIGSNLHRTLPVEEITREFNINETTLQQRFRAYSGLSLHAFLVQCRMEKASILLRDTDDPVKAVAGKCGYRKVHSFNKAFKVYWGVSPGGYRKRRWGQVIELHPEDIQVRSKVTQMLSKVTLSDLETGRTLP